MGYKPNGALEMIREYFKIKFRNTSEVGLFEFGIIRLIRGSFQGCVFDAFVVSPHKLYLRGFEFKTARSDFLRDVRSNKWRKYLKYCHLFYFVCPKGLIQKEEIESPAGLIWIWKDEDYIHSQMIKRPRKQDISQDIVLKIIALFVSRIKWRRNDFF